MIKIRVNSGDMYNRLKVLSKAQANKSSMVILDCVKIDVEDNAIMLTAGDADNMVQSCLAAEVVEGKGEAVCVRTDNLLVGLRELPNQPITLIVNGDSIRIDYSNGKFSFVGQPADDYPTPISVANDARHFFLNSEKLRVGINVCKKMVADDELRPIMCGIYFDLNTANRLTMVASNGNALARKIFNIANTIDPIGFILPLKASLVLANIIEKSDEEVGVSVDANRVMFKTSDYTLTSRLIEGKYPNYNAVIPVDNPIVLSLEKEMLVGCLRRVLISANDSTSLISVKLSKDTLLLSAKDEAYGIASDETISCDYEGQQFAIGFKGTLLLDVLSVISSEMVDIKLSEPNRAALIVPQEKTEGEDLTLLCMPMMLS